MTESRLRELWADLPGVSGLVRGMFAVGLIVSVTGSEVVVSLPNEVHRDKCEQRKAQVESALTDALGTPVRLSLVVEGGASGAKPAGSVAAPEPVDEFDQLEGADVHDLDDAPDASVGGLEALTEAFPGSTFVDES